MNPPTGPPNEADFPSNTDSLAYQQALKYGEDLVRVYLAEKERRQELEKANRLLSAVFDSTPQGIVVLSPDFVVQQVNRGFEKLIEQQAEQIVEQPIQEVLGNSDLLAALQDLGNDESSSYIELTLEHPIRRDLQLTLARLGEKAAAPGWIMVVDDLTKRKQIDLQKAEFINIAAHELRTPLANLIGNIQMLDLELAGSLPSDGQGYLDGVLRGSRRLHGIVEELLQFAELSGSGLPKSGIKDYRLCDLLEAVIGEAEWRARDHSVALRVECPPGLTMIVDSALLHTALYQLILNGIIFNHPEGEVNVRTSQANGITTISVTDTGRGIPQTDLGHIFDPFFQVDDSNIRRQGGMGLGLAIAQRSVALMNGRVEVESVLGEGTTITLHLPDAELPADPA